MVHQINQGSHDCHGAPLGDEEIALTRKALGWEYGPFEIPAEYYAEWSAKEKGAAAEKSWEENLRLMQKHTLNLQQNLHVVNGELPTNWAAESKAFIENYKLTLQALRAVKHHKMQSKLMHMYYLNS